MEGINSLADTYVHPFKPNGISHYHSISALKLVGWYMYFNIMFCKKNIKSGNPDHTPRCATSGLHRLPIYLYDPLKDAWLIYVKYLLCNLVHLKLYFGCCFLWGFCAG